eukprot:scaffold1954_cov268-Pinguiococcus_pyrenoidosus.AAC.94
MAVMLWIAATLFSFASWTPGSVGCTGRVAELQRDVGDGHAEVTNGLQSCTVARVSLSQASERRLLPVSVARVLTVATSCPRKGVRCQVCR